jgi:hypothetical protein
MYSWSYVPKCIRCRNNLVSYCNPARWVALCFCLHLSHFAKALKSDALKGVRLGVPRLSQPQDNNMVAAFNASLETVKELGVTIVDPADLPDP